MSGQFMTVREVMAEIVKDRIFYDQSGGGVTFSGGEPFAQPQFLDELLSGCRAEGIATVIDTCGYVERTTLISLSEKADLILYDLKGHDDARHQANTGVSAAPILENLDVLARVHGSIWLRLPVIPGYTDNPGEMELLASRYSSLKSIKRVTLLPYHPMGEVKLKKMGKPLKLPDLSAPTSSVVDRLAEIWLNHGFDTIWAK
jgi:pyruvate formate lyase activating enzyme